jgi:hypothetical protein
VNALADLHAQHRQHFTLAVQRLCAVFDAQAAGQTATYDGAGCTPPALAELARRFGLGAFERDLLLLCAAVERDDGLAQRAARARGAAAQPSTATLPGFDLAEQVLAGAERIALSPSAGLRHWRLLEPVPGAAPGPVWRSPLAVDERVHFYLDGHNAPDARLDGLLRPLPDRSGAVAAEALTRIANAWGTARAPGQCPVVEITGSGDRPLLAAAACAALGLQCWVLVATDIPATAAEREALARLWEREAMLLDAALLIDADDLPADAAPRLAALLQSLEAPVFVSRRTRGTPTGRAWMHCEAEGRLPADELQRWRGALGPLATALNGSVERTALQFRLDDTGLAAAAASARAQPSVADAAQALWDSARVQARGALGTLAERIEGRARWHDLVLPPAQTAVLHSIATHVRERDRVYRDWGFAAQSSRGLGIAALFSGGSGTGKTLAAEVLAHELRLDLYRVDLARLVSKYIGETEKNLARVFDAAEASGAIVLFDEADALFGKRSEVRDSHDRYANIEVSYLLQRIESHRGLCILTTNLKQALDGAFARRIRFIVQFPFPDAAARHDIWAQVFPPQLPREGLDCHKLARLHLAGGHIRNIALNAAFIAAGEGDVLRMAHLRSAAEAEYNKLEKPLPRVDVGDWA